MAIVMVMMTALVGFLTVASILGLSSRNSVFTWRTASLEHGDAAADAALEAAVGFMVSDLYSQGQGVVSNRVNAAAYDTEVINALAASSWGGVLESINVQEVTSTNTDESVFKVTAQARVDGLEDPVRSRASVELRMVDRPVTAFALCYDVDLEHYPWHNWTVTGPVYCGQVAYFCPVSGSDLTFQQPVYAVGGVVNGKHPLDPSSITLNGDITYEQELDTEATPMVQPPAPAGATNRMHWILETAPGGDYGTSTGARRFVNKADVVVTVDNGEEVNVYRGAKYAGGSMEHISSSLPAAMGFKDMYDGRESRTAELVVLDAEEVRDWMGSIFGGSRPQHPIIYIEDRRSWGSGTFSGVRVEKGRELDDQGMTVATPNPLYVRGNFNTIASKPAMLAGDSLTVLSAAWDDDDGASSVFTRDASNTTVVAAVVTGIVPADGSFGSGWVANVLRLLEDWNGRTLTHRGSLAVLYHSETATGVFYHGTYYIAPSERVFSFINLFENLSLGDVPAMKMAVRKGFQRLQPL
jgi:hypothetical protein